MENLLNHAFSTEKVWGKVQSCSQSEHLSVVEVERFGSTEELRSAHSLLQDLNFHANVMGQVMELVSVFWALFQQGSVKVNSSSILGVVADVFWSDHRPD